FLLVLLAGAVSLVPAAPLGLLALACGQLALPALGEGGPVGAPHGDLAGVRGAGQRGVDGGHLLAPVEHGPQLGDLEAVVPLGRVVPDDALPVDGHAPVVQGDLVAVPLDGEPGLPVAGVVPVPSPRVELVGLAHRSTSWSASSARTRAWHGCPSGHQQPSRRPRSFGSSRATSCGRSSSQVRYFSTTAAASPCLPTRYGLASTWPWSRHPPWN